MQMFVTQPPLQVAILQWAGMAPASWTGMNPGVRQDPPGTREISKTSGLQLCDVMDHVVGDLRKLRQSLDLPATVRLFVELTTKDPRGLRTMGRIER